MPVAKSTDDQHGLFESMRPPLRMVAAQLTAVRVSGDDAAGPFAILRVKLQAVILDHKANDIEYWTVRGAMALHVAFHSWSVEQWASSRGDGCRLGLRVHRSE